MTANNHTAITKNGVQRLAAPPALNLDLIESDKKLEDEEILKLLEQPISKSTGSKNKKKNKNKKKAASGEEEKKEE